ncbi:MAG: hypothetical protein PUE12_11155 [Oscillospiraceae bacterium]|nr:hypothetical protein [Oscillospiraceae bacterium]
MNFSVFSDRLVSIIGQGESTSNFVRTLFDTIILEEHLELIPENKETLKSYHNGYTQINRLSKKIISYIEPEQFADYINNFPDPVIENLCSSFNDIIPDIDNRNCGEKIAYLFQDIIKTAASTKRSSPQKSEQKIEIPPPTNESSEGNINITDNDIILLNEFTIDYDQLIQKCISDNYSDFFLDGSISLEIEKLYEDKWKEKSSSFVDISLKSKVINCLATLDALNKIYDENSEGTVRNIRIERKKLRNLYVKLHPEKYAGDFPFAIEIDDWNDVEFF